MGTIRIIMARFAKKPRHTLYQTCRCLGVMVLCLLFGFGGTLHCKGRYAAFFMPAPASENKDCDSCEEETENTASQARTVNVLTRSTSRKKNDGSISMPLPAANQSVPKRAPRSRNPFLSRSRSQNYGTGLLPIRC